LQGLGKKDFYIDGGASVRTFDELGDSTVQDAITLINQAQQEKETIVGNTAEEEFD
jgi:hypothetical protein